MHKLLQRQVKRCLDDREIPGELCSLIAAVDEAYHQADRDRQLLEHSMDVVSDEHLERYLRLNEALAEARREADQLRRTKALMASVLDSTAEGVLVVDADGRIVQWNRRFAELWRIPEDVLAAGDDGRALEFVLGQLTDPDAFLRKVRDLYADPEAESFDVLRFTDGRVFERYSMPHRLEGAPVGRMWSFRDVTERQRLEGQLRQSQKMEAVGQLAGGIAHDFNNIITVIGGHVDLLREALAPGDPRIDDADEIGRAATRAAALTRQMLAFSRRQVLRPAILDVNAVINGIEPMLRRLINADIDVRTRLAAPPVRALVDGGQLEQVILNLALNARDAMPRGGVLTISTGETTLDADQARGLDAAAGRHAVIAVTDTGCGIAPDIRERIFEPFFTTKEAGRGTGLGLSTVFGIVRQSGGCVTVRSEVGNGTTFEVYLPVAAGTPSAAEPGPSQAVVGGHETILLAEDDDTVRITVRRILQRHGYQVLVGRDGPEAERIAALHPGPIELLLTDVVMPGLGGAGLAEQVRRRHPGIRVLFMSGYTDDELVRRGVEASFLCKPFSSLALAAAVREALDRTAGPGAAAAAFAVPAA